MPEGREKWAIPVVASACDSSYGTCVVNRELKPGRGAAPADTSALKERPKVSITRRWVASGLFPTAQIVSNPRPTEAKETGYSAFMISPEPSSSTF
jgi:hypothetical protein